MRLEDGVDDYLRFLKCEQGAAKTTYKAYHAGLYAFVRWMRQNGYTEPALADLTTPLCRRFLYHLSGKGLRPRSIFGYFSPLRAFGTWLVAQGGLTENPVMGVKLPKKDAAVRKVTTEEEIAALLAAVERQRNPRKVAYQRAALAVLVYTGLRRAEVCDLHVSDVNLTEKSLLVRSGKGSKSRRVFLCRPCLDALREWLAVRHPDCTHPYLFGIDRKRRLYYAGLRSIVEEVKALAGFADRTHIAPHSLLHAFATRLLRNGADLKNISAVLGHTLLQTTAAYLHASEEAARDIADLAALSPAKPPEMTDGKVIRAPQRDQERRRLHRIAR